VTSFDTCAHGPFEFTARLIDAEPPGFAVLDVRSKAGKVSLLDVTRAECDALVRAALAARDLLPGCDETCPDTKAHRALMGEPVLPDSIGQLMDTS
jgi:hypothetical protein